MDVMAEGLHCRAHSMPQINPGRNPQRHAKTPRPWGSARLQLHRLGRGIGQVRGWLQALTVLFFALIFVQVAIGNATCPQTKKPARNGRGPTAGVRKV
jgi:hypothetical protein